MLHLKGLVVEPASWLLSDAIKWRHELQPQEHINHMKYKIIFDDTVENLFAGMLFPTMFLTLNQNV